MLSSHYKLLWKQCTTCHFVAVTTANFNWVCLWLAMVRIWKHEKVYANASGSQLLQHTMCLIYKSSLPRSYRRSAGGYGDQPGWLGWRSFRCHYPPPVRHVMKEFERHLYRSFLFDLLQLEDTTDWFCPITFGWMHHVPCMHHAWKKYPCCSWLQWEDVMIKKQTAIDIDIDIATWNLTAFFPFALRWLWKKLKRCTLRAQSAWISAKLVCWRPQLFTLFKVV